MNLVLSVFPGIGIFDRAFEAEGFTVVRGPDLLWGGNIKSFRVPPGIFQGIIGGLPCQCSRQLLSIIRHNGYQLGENLIPEFQRVVSEAQPDWFVMENVKGAPIPLVDGYQVNPTLLNSRWLGAVQSRLHRFSFGTHDGRKLDYRIAGFEHIDWDYRVCASDYRGTPVRLLAGKKQRDPKHRKGSLNCRERPKRPRSVCEILRLQGLPEDFMDHSPFTKKGQVEMLGNAVPYFMAVEVAQAVRRLGL